MNPLWCVVLLLSVLRFSPRENEVFYDVVAIVDPLTREAQKMSPLLIVSCILVSLLYRFLIWQGDFKIKGRVQKQIRYVMVIFFYAHFYAERYCTFQQLQSIY